MRTSVHSLTTWMIKFVEFKIKDPNITLVELRILYHWIQVATPRYNGKVERQHRTDEARFYKHMRMYSLEDGRKQLRVYQKKSNNYIKTCLGMKSPNTIVRMYQGVMF